ncbi:GntR family transcriptional regulator [Nocardia sp. NPDC049707]|uniref:GntR family transcriptional regulator n=1 Tax=Nocardia sp. NPDC049707 TaxID=3154735 RepID=UPI003421D3A5
MSKRSGMISADVYERITAMILRNELRPGTRINIDQLAHTLDVSATPVREALARLESDGLVTKIHLKGYRTAEVLGRRELEEIYQFRLRLEPYSAAQAAQQATNDDVARLTSELSLFESPPIRADYDSYRQFSAHDARLHALILEIADNNVIAQALERTHFHLHAFRLAYDAAAGARTIGEHKEVVAAIAAGDPARADKAMRTHLENAMNRLLPTSLAPPTGNG